MKTTKMRSVKILCRACGFTGALRILKALRTPDDLARSITKESLERASVRILARRYGKTKNTVLKIIHRVTASLPDSISIQRRFLPRWSGVLVFDGKVIRVYDKLSSMLKDASFSEDELRWMNKMRWLMGIDHGTGDLPHYALVSSESRIDLVMYFKTLDELNYPLNAVVCDGNPEIPRAAKFVFGDQVIIQRCTRHFLEDLRRMLPSDDQRMREREKLEELISRIKSIIEAKTIENAMKRYRSLNMRHSRYRSPIAKQMIMMFLETREELCAHLLHPELHLPHTTNDAENLFKQLNLRLRSLGRFSHHAYARDYLNAWALLRRFTPFTDCRKNRRYRNGKSPIALAGCEVSNIDPLKLKNSNLEVIR